MYQNSIVFSGFSRKSGIFFVEGRTSRRKGANNKNCYFLIFLISFLALAADKTPADHKLPEDFRCLKVSVGACDD